MTISTTCEAIAIGVGLDTARYGHHATFLREDRQPAAKPLEFLECREGYQQLEDTMTRLAQQHDTVHFYIRVDTASQYATNLLAFLHRLPWQKTISVGQPTQNKRYREVHFPKRKSDATDSHACARFAIVERPHSSALVSSDLLALREVASRLDFQVKQSTQIVNRLHNLLTRVFPELATLINDLQVRWILDLLKKYPTAERIAKARLSSLTAIKRISEAKAEKIRKAAQQSIASESGPVMEEVVRESVRALLASLDAEKRLEKLLIQAFRDLPDKHAKQIATIKGIGERTAAVLVAKIGCIDRFPTASHLTSYFGVFPEERSSGVDRDGKSLPSTSMHMSRKGNDLVRKYLWMSAMSSLTCNPVVIDLYARLKQRGWRGDVALGHCMKKLLHLVFGIWKSGKPFNPNHASPKEVVDSDTEMTVDEKSEAEGRKAGNIPVRKTVTSTSTDIVATQQQRVKQPTPSDNVDDDSIDFAYLRSQITMERVLRHLGYFGRLRGSGVQLRGPCPVHGTKRERGRSFSVHLHKGVFQCFHPPCGAAGNILDLWCAVNRLTLYDGAQHLADTFDLQLKRNTEKRNP
jgi:transposase